MKTVGADLRAEMISAVAALRELTDGDVTASRGAGKWTKKEILGHLIDSAANNHQRFVRAQLSDQDAGPGYEQDGWVSVQRYRDRRWTELLDLWSAQNGHLAHLIETVPPAKLATRCIIGNDEPVTLEWLMRDYLRHLRHHLAQLLS
jgi:hypothetical protein